MTLPKDLAKLLAAGALLLGVLLGLGKLLVEVLLDGPVGRFDDRIASDLADGRTRTGDSLSRAGSALADPLTVQVLLVVCIVGVALLTRRLRPPLFVALAVGVESAIYFLVSTWVPRDRPHVPRPGPADPIASFPSGHAAASLCLYGALAVLAWRLTSNRPLQLVLTGAAVVVPLVVAFCRMYRGYHHLTDVLAGLLLGGVWLALCTRYVLREQVSA
jgi:undecaprenyl-diphosphatase